MVIMTLAFSNARVMRHMRFNGIIDADCLIRPLASVYGSYCVHQVQLTVFHRWRGIEGRLVWFVEVCGGFDGGSRKLGGSS